MQKQELPGWLQGLVWIKKIQDLDLEQDKVTIIHHVLRYGKISQIAWLLKTYPHDVIKEIFVSKPENIYSPSAFYFVKNAVLKIKEKIPNEQYIQHLY